MKTLNKVEPLKAKDFHSGECHSCKGVFELQDKDFESIMFHIYPGQAQHFCPNCGIGRDIIFKRKES